MVAVAAGPGCCGVDDAFTRETRRIGMLGRSHNAVDADRTDNSSATVYTILQEMGLPLLKPAVSAPGWGTNLHREQTAPERLVWLGATLEADCNSMVIGNNETHAIGRNPAKTADDQCEGIGGTCPTNTHRRLMASERLQLRGPGVRIMIPVGKITLEASITYPKGMVIKSGGCAATIPILLTAAREDLPLCKESARWTGTAHAPSNPASRKVNRE